MIYFILNPNSGSKSNRSKSQMIKDLRKIEHSKLYLTQYPGHGYELVKRIIAENKASKVIAIGGDGTLNEIGSALIGSNIPLGIIPIGSGNGLARHLQIPLDFTLALKRAREGKSISIDFLTWNEKPFFCTAGIGFDAEVAHSFANSHGRGLWNYIMATIKQIFKYKYTKFCFESKNESLFSLTCANASQFGNNAFISPFSDLQDAQFEVIKVKKVNVFEIGQLGISLFLKNIHQHPKVEILQKKIFEFEVLKGTHFHLDGESFVCDNNLVKVEIFSKKLIVIT